MSKAYILARGHIGNLEEAKHTVLVNSGISTLALALAIIDSGKQVVVQDDFYSGTRHLVSKVFSSRVSQTTLRPGDDAPSRLRDLLVQEGDSIGLILLESPSNPLL